MKNRGDSGQPPTYPRVVVGEARNPETSMQANEVPRKAYSLLSKDWEKYTRQQDRNFLRVNALLQQNTREETMSPPYIVEKVGQSRWRT